VCFTPRKVKGDDGQCHDLFHSTRTIGGKVCKLVIDGVVARMWLWRTRSENWP
jgi:hypothetical protein